VWEKSSWADKKLFGCIDFFFESFPVFSNPMASEFAYKSDPTTLVLFDIDGTLTPARKVFIVNERQSHRK
jgi:hypothetical protein